MRDVSFTELHRRWASIVPPAVAGSSWPRVLTDGGVLVVEAAGPWLRELEERAPAILAALPLVDGNVVLRLKFIYIPPTNPPRVDVQPIARRRGARKRGR
jgi:predicted nucleic acid-binding Zn ribbon protein